MYARIVEHVVPDGRRNQRLRLDTGDIRTPGPCDIQLRSEFRGQTLPVVEHVLVPRESPRQSTRVRFRVKDIPQPDEHADGGIYRVAFPQRCGDFKRVANGQRHRRCRTYPSECFVPEIQQPADSRVLENEQPALSELSREHVPRPFEEILRNPRLPMGI